MDRSEYPYTAFYCEENIWHLCQLPQFEMLQKKVVLLSNPNRSCLLQRQRAGHEPHETVFWDYHVLLLVLDKTWKVWDLDTSLGLPVAFDQYVEKTFPRELAKLSSEYVPSFRVLDSSDYIKSFSSDRSHMRLPDGSWSAPPPTWPMILNAQKSNLMQLIDMELKYPGAIMTMPEFVNAFHASPH